MNRRKPTPYGILEWSAVIEARMMAVTTTRDDRIAADTGRTAALARQLCTVSSMTATSLAAFTAELFGLRMLCNGQSLGTMTRLAPYPPFEDP